MGSRMMFAICCLASLFFELVHGDSTLALLIPMTESSVDLTGSSSTFVVNGNLGVYTDSLGVSKPGYSFSPTPGYIVVSQSAALDVGRNTFSIAMWVKFDRLDLKQQIFSHRNRAVYYDCSGTKGYELSLTSSGSYTSVLTMPPVQLFPPLTSMPTHQQFFQRIHGTSWVWHSLEQVSRLST